MSRTTLSLVFALSLCVSALAADTMVILNGDTVSIPVIDQNGKAFVDIAAFVKLLGGKATYLADTHKLMINLLPQGAGGGGTSAPGTAELAGDTGELGKLYSMGKDSPLFFRLESAELTVGQVVIGDTIHAPAADEKFLLLSFTVQNPQKDDLPVRYDSLNFTAVDQANTNHVGDFDWGDPANHAKIDLTLKPAQKIAAYTIITLPAAGQVPKLMVQRRQDDNAPILRFDLRGKLKQLAAPFADPADATGCTALVEVPAEATVAYPCKNFNVTLESTADVTTALAGEAPDEGARYLVATLSLKNVAPTETGLRWDSLTSVLTSTDGQTLKYGGLLAGTGDAAFDQAVKPGWEGRVRLYFTVPKDVTPKTLAIKEDTSRSFVYTLK